MLKIVFLSLLLLITFGQDLFQLSIDSALSEVQNCMSGKHPCLPSSLDCSDELIFSSNNILKSISVLFEMISPGTTTGSHLTAPGVRSGILKVTASSYFNSSVYPDTSIFDYTVGGVACGWVPASNDPNQYIQYSSPIPYVFEKIITTGRTCYSSYVKQFKVFYSLNGINWTSYKNNHVFNANFDDSTPVENIFEPFVARAIRIFQVSFQGSWGLKAEVYISKQISTNQLAPSSLISGYNTGFNIISSSIFDSNSLEQKLLIGGLYNSDPTTWKAAISDLYQWVIFNSGVLMNYKKIASRGRKEESAWVSSYYVMYTDDGINWLDYKNKLAINANVDSDGIVENALEGFIAIAIRIHFLTWVGSIAGQFDVYCSEV